jgi:phage N-6-adenine-methyltransferase
MSGWTEDKLFSSKKHDWETPQALFDALDEEFGFELDAAASPDNAKCKHFFTEDEDALTQDWSAYDAVWCNPPYGRGIGDWMIKCAREGLATTVVALVFARTDTRWFHDWIAPYASQVRFIKGRLKFSRGGRPGDSAPAPSMVVIWSPVDGSLPRLHQAVNTMEQP